MKHNKTGEVVGQSRIKNYMYNRNTECTLLALPQPFLNTHSLVTAFIFNQKLVMGFHTELKINAHDNCAVRKVTYLFPHLNTLLDFYLLGVVYSVIKRAVDSSLALGTGS